MNVLTVSFLAAALTMLFGYLEEKLTNEIVILRLNVGINGWKLNHILSVLHATQVE